MGTMSFTDKEIEQWDRLHVDLMQILAAVDSPVELPKWRVQEKIKEHIQAVYDTKDLIEDYHNRLIEEIEREVIGEYEGGECNHLTEHVQGVTNPLYDVSPEQEHRNKLRAEQRKKLAEYKV